VGQSDYGEAMSTEGMSAYQSNKEMSSPPALPGKVSKIPTVLGILHLCFGGVSLLSSGMSVVQGKKISEELSAQMDSIEGGEISISEGSVELLSVVDQPVQIVGVADLIVCVLMIFAGIALIKYKSIGRKLTNIYALLSLSAKGMSAYIWCVLATPFFESFIQLNPALDVVGVNGMRAVVVATLVFTSIYAVISLVLVNRKSVVLSLRSEG